MAFTYPGKDIYDEIAGKPYFSCLPGEKTTYRTDFGKYSRFCDSALTLIQGKEYFKQTIDYGTSQTIAYYRIDKGTTLYLKPGQSKETMETPADPKEGTVWYESDSTWRYTITNTKATFETPEARFANCLEIQSEDLRARKGQYSLYTQFHQRGRGYIGTKIGGVLFSYMILPDK